MEKKPRYQKSFSTARFKRAIFFAHIIFLSCTSFAADGVYSASFSKNSDSINSLRSFMQEGHATSGNTSLIRQRTHKNSFTKQVPQKYETPEKLLTVYQIDVDSCLALQNVPCREMSVHLKTKSKEELIAIKKSLDNFLWKLSNDDDFRKCVLQIPKVGFYEAIKIGKKKFFGHRKQVPAIKHYANHAYQAVCNALKDLEAQQNPDAFKAFCHNFLKIKIGKTALYLLQRFMMGLEKGGIDIRNALMRERQKGFSDFASNFLQKVRTQPVKQTVGDVVQLLSQKIVHASAIIVAVAAIAITIEAGAVLASGTASAIAAQKLFEPFVLNINPDGTAAIKAAASSGVSIWQSIAVALSQAVQAFAGLIENVGNLFCATQGGGGNIQLSKAKFGHSLTTHGEDMTHFLTERAKGSNTPQGQFLDNQQAAKFILDNLDKTKNGPVSIKISESFSARIIMPDGSFALPTHIRLVPGGKGVLTAYPIIIKGV